MLLSKTLQTRQPAGAQSEGSSMRIFSFHRVKACVLTMATLLTTLIGISARADDTEIFYGASATASAPNIMLILDTSGSMETNVTTRAAYLPATSYTGNCVSDRIYYTTSSSVPNTSSNCNGVNYVTESQFKCSPAVGTTGALAKVGAFSDYAIRWITTTTTTTSSSTPKTDTTVATVVRRYTASSSHSSIYASSSSSSTSTGSAAASSTSNTTYSWQNTLNKNSSSSASSATSITGTSSSSSSSSSSINVTTSSPPRTWVRQVTTTTTTVVNSTTTQTTASTSYTLGDVTCFTHDTSITNYPNNVNPTSTTDWTTTSTNSYWNNGGTRTTYYFYTGNYLNYYNSSSTSTTRTRLQIMQDAATTLLNSSTGVNVGLMRYDAKNAQGGMVIHAASDIATSRNNMIASINSWQAEGYTPLRETLYEAYLYFVGGTVKYGNTSYVYSTSSSSGCSGSSGNYYCSKPSVADSRVSSSSSASSYNSPMDYSCQKNYIVYLTDGEPTNDTDADSLINSLNSSASSSTSSCSGNNCLSALTRYIYNNDLNSSLAEKQNVTTYFIGLGSDFTGSGSSSSVTSAFSLLQTAATAGGGNAYSAGDLTELSKVFRKIFDSIRTDASTFTSPSVAVNAFNKTQVLEDLYVSVFQPSSTTHWPGNLKKYKLRDGVIVGQSNTSAVSSSTGFLQSTAMDYWSSSVDGNDKVIVGGAANLIPTPASRTVYTYTGTNPGSGEQYKADMEAFNIANTNITAATLGTTSALRDQLIDWARGMDVLDDDGDDDSADARNVMGDPIHSQPAVVIYGQTGSTATAKLNDALVFVATNDGYLHAIDVSTGVEQWAFIPKDALSNLSTLFANDVGDTKKYILDGNIRVLKYDVDGDGVVEPSAGDRVILYFSQGRGGSAYYAIDVTVKNTPKFMWRLSGDKLPNIGKSWSTPVISSVKVGSGAGQNSQYLTLIFAGGYDEAEENVSYVATNTYGKALYMVDAVNGGVLWSGGYPGIADSSGNAASQSFAGMDHAIPSDVTVIDTDGDGFTDRMYVGDMAGQLWRFDITNGNSASQLVAGGVIASLGTHDDTIHTNANNRRFYNPPDVAAINPKGGKSYYNVAIGSGYRGHPKDTATADRFYSIRDYNPYTKLTQAQYNSYDKTTDAELDDVTNSIYNGTVATLSTNTQGWKLVLNGTGEKILSNSITLSGTVMFTSYIPTTTSSSTTCSTTTGISRTYSINVQDASWRFDDAAYESNVISGLTSTTQVVPTNGIVSTDTGISSSSSSSSSSDPDDETPGTCLSGLTVLNNCVEFGSRIKTFWRETGAN